MLLYQKNPRRFPSRRIVGTASKDNLQFAKDSGHYIRIKAATVEDPVDFQSIDLDTIGALRFGSYNLPTAGPWARILISAPTVITNLQEITIQ